MQPAALAELKKRGASNIRLLLANADAVGAGAGAAVPLGLSPMNPSRGEVEEWLRAQEMAAEKVVATRYAEQMAVARQGVWWAQLAFYAGVGSIIVTIVFGVIAIKFH